MAAIQSLLAFFLLTAPADTFEPPEDQDVLLLLAPSLQAAAIQLEILDPREVRYVLTRPEDLASDLKLLRKRYEDLNDAPGLQDANRFPDRTMINDLLAFNRAYRQNMDSRRALDLVHWWDLQETLQETDRLYQVWDTLRDARCDYYYITVRRQALKRLREMVGEEAYFSGALPPHVPLWRFQEIN